MGEQRREFWKKHPGLVWSNPDASDSVHIRAALLRPRFDRLLENAVEFGLERLRREWSVLEEENSPDFIRAREPVQRILKNLEKGFASVAAGN